MKRLYVHIKGEERRSDVAVRLPGLVVARMRAWWEQSLFDSSDDCLFCWGLLRQEQNCSTFPSGPLWGRA